MDRHFNTNKCTCYIFLKNETTRSILTKLFTMMEKEKKTCKTPELIKIPKIHCHWLASSLNLPL